MEESREERKKRLRRERDARKKQKILDEALEVECACGCGEIIKQTITHGVTKKFVQGHNSKVDANNRKQYVDDNKPTPRQQRDREIKERSYKKKWENAPYIDCACGCGEKIKSFDKYGRKAEYVNGHNCRKFQDPNEFKRNYSKRNRVKNRQYSKNRSRKQKATLLEYKGNKCVECGITYDGTNAAMFDFHHRVPAEKEFNLTTAAFRNFSLEKIYKEIEKCDLFCANCHRLLHNDKF